MVPARCWLSAHLCCHLNAVPVPVIASMPTMLLSVFYTLMFVTFAFFVSFLLHPQAVRHCFSSAFFILVSVQFLLYSILSVSNFQNYSILTVQFFFLIQFCQYSFCLIQSCQFVGVLCYQTCCFCLDLIQPCQCAVCDQLYAVCNQLQLCVISQMHKCQL